MPPTKRIAHKITLHVDEQGGAAFTQLGGVYKATDAAESRGKIDMTDLEDDFICNFPDSVEEIGDVVVSVYWDEADTDHQRFRTLVRNPQPNAPEWPAWEIQMAIAGRKISFDGWVSNLANTTYEVQGKVMKDVTITLMSLPVIATI